MTTEAMDLDALKAPFPPDDIEWRIARSGEKNGKIWAQCLAYITSRAIMDRLDDVCGPGNWQVEYREGHGHMQAGIGVRLDGEWVWKWDGAGNLAASDGLSVTDAGKGDFSNAMKRAAVQWGIGRYLYNLPEGWAVVSDSGRFFAKTKDKKPFHWDPPALPAWALPSGETDPIIEEMQGLWIKAAELGLDSETDTAKGMARIDDAIRKGDVVALRKAKKWVEDKIAKAKEAVAA